MLQFHIVSPMHCDVDPRYLSLLTAVPTLSGTKYLEHKGSWDLLFPCDFVWGEEQISAAVISSSNGNFATPSPTQVLPSLLRNDHDDHDEDEDHDEDDDEDVKDECLGSSWLSDCDLPRLLQILLLPGKVDWSSWSWSSWSFWSSGWSPFFLWYSRLILVLRYLWLRWWVINENAVRAANRYLWFIKPVSAFGPMHQFYFAR